jgi:hypothetical protein
VRTGVQGSAAYMGHAQLAQAMGDGEDKREGKDEDEDEDMDGNLITNNPAK